MRLLIAHMTILDNGLFFGIIFVLLRPYKY